MVIWLWEVLEEDPAVEKYALPKSTVVPARITTMAIRL
jgi:hypothetical protein